MKRKNETHIKELNILNLGRNPNKKEDTYMFL